MGIFPSKFYIHYKPDLCRYLGNPSLQTPRFTIFVPITVFKATILFVSISYSAKSAWPPNFFQQRVSEIFNAVVQFSSVEAHKLHSYTRYHLCFFSYQCFQVFVHPNACTKSRNKSMLGCVNYTRGSLQLRKHPH